MENNTKHNKIIKWYTESIYIDITTGEIISRSTAYRDYIIIDKKKKTKINGTIGTIKITNECTPAWKQGKLF